MSAGRDALAEPVHHDPVLPPGSRVVPRGDGWHLDGYLWDERTGLARLRHERHGEHPVHVYQREGEEGPEMVMARFDPAEGRFVRYVAEPSPYPGRPDRWRGARPYDVAVVHQMRPSGPHHEGWQAREPIDREAALVSYFANLRQELELVKRGAYAGPRPAIRRN